MHTSPGALLTPNIEAERESICKACEVPSSAKNGWQLAEATREASPYSYQELFSRAYGDADAVRNDLLELAQEKLADPESVVVIAETGFIKKGPNRSEWLRNTAEPWVSAKSASFSPMPAPRDRS